MPSLFQRNQRRPRRTRVPRQGASKPLLKKAPRPPPDFGRRVPFGPRPQGAFRNVRTYLLFGCHENKQPRRKLGAGMRPAPSWVTDLFAYGRPPHTS